MEMRRWGERYVGFGRYDEKKGVEILFIQIIVIYQQ